MSRTCPECGRSHSEFDPRCPSCGTPLPTTIGGPPPAAAAAPLGPGSRLGRFEILAELGRGGMGVVYRARDTQLGREVALKLLAGGADHQRLLREARAVAALDHPAIGTLYEVGAAPGVSFLVLALYQGGTLQAELAERGALPLAEAAEMLRQLAGALAAAHAAGICHRDVKPSNVFRLADGRLKLIDFGIARHGGSAAASGSQRPVGTAAYMAPERLRGEDPGPPADVWSLAVLGWEISTGGHPFDLARPGWLARVQAARLSPAGGEPPPALAAIFAPCLALDPAARPAAAALEEKFSGLAGLAADSVRRAAAPPTFRRATVALAAAGAVALAATLSVFLLRTPEKPRVVVLLPPRVEGGMAAGDRQRLAANLDASSWRVLLGLDGVEAVDRALARQGRGEPAAAARATAADETLGWEADCPGVDLCSARLLRRDAAGKVLGSESIELSAAADAISARAAAAAVRRLYQGLRPKDGSSLAEPGADYYQRYLELRAALDRRSVTPEAALGELEQLAALAGGPPPPELSALDAGLCRFLLARDRDPRWLARGLATAEAGLRQAPGDALLLATRFDLLLESRQLPASREALAALEKSGAGLGDLLIRRARLAEAEGRPREALALLTRLVADRPAVYFLLTLANLEERLGETAKARSHLGQALERAPENAAARAQLAGLDLNEGRLEAAAEGWRTLAEQTPTVDALGNYGLALMLSRRYAEAVEAYRRALALDERQPETRLNLADALALLGREEEAESLYRGLAAEDPGENAGWQAWAIAAQAHAHLGEQPAARRALAAMLGRAPENPAAATSAALVHALLGDREAALAEARRAKAAGQGKIWFELPFFDPLADELEAAGVRGTGRGAQG